MKNKFTIEQLNLVKTMSDQHKHIMILYYIEKLPSYRIGMIMGMPTENVQYIITHFTKRVLEKIGANDSESL